MKSFSNLWETFISDETIKLAINLSSQGKRNRREVKYFYNDIENSIEPIREYATNFYNEEHFPIEIYDGVTRKKRIIVVPRYNEQIIHHMCVLTLMPLFTKGMYEHTYASIPNRGAHKAAKVIKKWIRDDWKGTKFCLKMDIRKYFDSIPHSKIKALLRKHIKDDKFLEVLFKIIDVTGTEYGLPLGFYTSQWLANWYLQRLDHYIKEELKAPYYVRYMDDMVIIGPNKKKLHKMRKAIDKFLREELGVELKDNYQVFKITDVNCLDFMGFRFFRNRVTLRRNIFLRARRKAKRIYKKRLAKKRITAHDARQMLSYMGWFKATDTYQAFCDYIKPYISVRNLRAIISRKDNIRNGKKPKDVEKFKSHLRRRRKQRIAHIRKTIKENKEKEIINSNK